MAAALSKIPPKEPDPPKIDESEKPAPTKTYLEGVLHDATKKKGRRVKVAETVRSVTETRSDILCKAQAVLGRNNQDDSESDGDMSEPEPQFAPSKLAIRRRSPARTSGSPSINKRKTATFDELEGLMKPTTRSEIISRLDQAIFQANLNGYALPRSEMKVPDLHSARTIATENTLEFGDLIATEDIRHEDSLHDYALTTDDAYLHYDPGVSAALTPIHSPWRRQNGQSKSNRSPPHKLPASPRTPPKSPRKRAPKAASETPRRKGKARAEEEFGDAWRQQLNDAIVNNSALHLRILRYEPVHFDEFVNLMIDKPTTNSRAALKLFLDERAISFYGATVRKRR
ncbi:hypothetical protein PLEOSDRAFT_1082235 [Pleurotus ostreatus PC15]|uniref:Structure-specific endonuclease subunit SLX4 n=1 Tax=Pleurotus ostreatus (strain PC15) TaxID=1137138 RepID=A0A067P562_PLEO1|nr:hypothetical protein PLEOSDRAFT_1082235 [Pleurotus ostreatus PC15]